MRNRKGQNTAEYAILIALIVAAAVAMQTYVKRGLQGRVADAVDHAPVELTIKGEKLNFGTRQYEPYYLDSKADIDSKRDYTENWETRGDIDRGGINEETKRLTTSYEAMTWKDADFGGDTR